MAWEGKGRQENIDINFSVTIKLPYDSYILIFSHVSMCVLGLGVLTSGPNIMFPTAFWSFVFEHINGVAKHSTILCFNLFVFLNRKLICYFIETKMYIYIPHCILSSNNIHKSILEVSVLKVELYFVYFIKK